jgi:Ca2+-binding RTX toxin-like protein
MSTSNAGLVFSADFNGSANIPNMGFMYSGNTTPRVTDIAGQRAVKIDLNHYSDPIPYRTELQPNKLPSPDFTSGMFAKMGQDYWYGMRTYLPANWAPDKSAESFIQWHTQPDPGEAWRGSAVSLVSRPSPTTGEARMVVIVRADADRITPSSGGESRYDSSKIYDLGPVSQYVGKWSEWVWHIKWGYNNTGNLQLWNNSKKVLDLPNQGNSFNDATGPYLKFGDYKWAWESASDTGADSRTIYFDDVRIGNGSAGYNTVTPGTGAVAAASGAVATSSDLDISTTTVAGETKIGTRGDDNLVGTAGNDVLKGWTGSDKLSGGDRNDTLRGGSGNDRIDGGNGHDTLDLSDLGVGVKVDLDAGYADGGAGQRDTIVNIESVLGTGNNDQIFGNSQANSLNGNNGSDMLAGRGGADMLTGGAGHDTFIFDKLKAGTATITDFTIGEDKVDLRGILAPLQSAHLEMKNVVSLVQVGDNAEVRVDADGAQGAGAAETITVLSHVNANAVHLSWGLYVA